MLETWNEWKVDTSVGYDKIILPAFAFFFITRKFYQNTSASIKTLQCDVCRLKCIGDIKFFRVAALNGIHPVKQNS